MQSFELRNLDEARTYLLQGLWWQRVVSPTAASVRPALEWAMELASTGHPVPPVGFIADVGHAALSMDWELRATRSAVIPPALPVNLLSTYEDHVLGKLYSDWTFARAGDALRRYEGRDRSRGVAYLIGQLCERAHIPGVEFAPGVIKQALESPPDEVLLQGWEQLRQEDVQPLLVELYEALIRCARRTAEVLGQEDIFELESRTALAEYGERLALRQVLQAAASFETALPRHKLRPLAHRMEVPTRILDEDTYPVGGFTSISTRGSIESLLHSQLAYMEADPSLRPDLFDIKFLRDELLYYSRDENQFLRRRRTFVFAFHPDLIATRFKDKELPYQRGILMLALVLVIVRKLIEWLSSDALVFHLLFLDEGDEEPLKKERELLQLLLAEQITNQTVQIDSLPSSQLGKRCTEWARRSMCHCLNVGVTPGTPQADDVVITRLQLNGARPALGDAFTEPAFVEGEEALDSWSRAVQHILQLWI